MVSFRSPLIFLSAAAAAYAIPFRNSTNNYLERRTTITNSSNGTVNGYYYSLCEQNNSGVTMDVGIGQYNLSWLSPAQDFVAGVGWNPGSAKVITYSGSFNTNGNAYLSVYGWTTNPLVEYYICDSFGSYNPGTGLTHKGTVSSDGATYDIYQVTRVNTVGNLGTPTFNQFWSLRQEKRVGGTITTANHFNAWKKLGMNMGTFSYQILATEGYNSNGSSSITVSGYDDDL